MDFLTLKVEGVEESNGRYVIKSGGKSYSFFAKKKDGTESRAFKDFKELGVQIGEHYSFGVSESKGKTKDGSEITYHNIGVIGKPVDYPQPTESQVSDGVTKADFDALKVRVETLEMAKGLTPVMPDDTEEITVDSIPF